MTAGASPAGPGPIALVHGFGSSSAQTWGRNGWLDILAELGRPVVPIDLLGHGTAPRPEDPAGYDRAEAHVRDALPRHPRLGGVGFSAGADTLLRIAVGAPATFERLALLGLGDDVFSERDAEPVAAVFDRPEDDEADIGARLFRRMAAAAGNDPAAMAAFLRRPRRPMEAAELGRLHCPVLVVLGSDDPIGSADRLVGALPDAALVTLRGVDHFATPSDFGAIDAVVRFFS